MMVNKLQNKDKYEDEDLVMWVKRVNLIELRLTSDRYTGR